MSQKSHEHSLETLLTLYDHDDFMDSIGSMADLGCGAGDDIMWWSTLETREDPPEPHNYQCYAIDKDLRKVTRRGEFPDNVVTLKGDFEKNILPVQVDLLWSHDSFQYCTNPLSALKRWNSFLNEDGMLCMVIPQTVDFEFNRLMMSVHDRQYFNLNIANMIYMLALNGFDCADGHFLKKPGDPWLHIAVYKSDIAPMDPFKTSLYEVAETGLMPESAADGILKYGYLKQQNLFTHWIDGTLTDWMKI